MTGWRRLLVAPSALAAAPASAKSQSARALGLAALLALAALASFAATSASATGLCNTDTEPCGSATTSVHETSVGKAVILTSAGNAECNVLFSSTSVGAGGGTVQILEGNFTYTNCVLGGSSCTTTEENGPAEIKIEKTGTETAKVTGAYLFHVVCSGFIDCSYNGVGVVGTGKGPLVSTQTNGEVTFKEQSLTKEAGGFLCPKIAKLDITTTPLSAIYIKSSGGGLSSTSTSLSTSLKGGGKEGAEITVAEGSKVKDTATLSGENASKAGGTVDYAVYKDKECKELVTEAGKVTVKEGKVPDSEEKELEAGKEYFWQAKYLGDEMNKESTSTCSKEVLKVKANTSLSTSLSGGGKEGAEITVAEGSKVKDTATLSGTNVTGATGTVDYAVYKDKECKELATEAGKGKVEGSKVASSEEKELEAGAVYYWQAKYLGDSLHEESTSTCSKEVLTVKAKVTLSTKLSGGGKEGEGITVAEGSKVKDQATLSGTKSSTAGGTIKYAVYKDKECKELATSAGEGEVKEGKAPASEEKELEAGAVYYWQAEYGGDSLHEASTSSCSKEVETVKANTSLSTSLKGGGKEGAEITVAEGSKVKDTATLSGTKSSTATGTVKYKVYSDSKCETLVTNAGEVSVSGGSVPNSEEKELEAGAVYYWQAEYGGDSLHAASTSPCNEIETVKAKVTLSTKLSGGGKEGEEITVAEGSNVKDQATLSGTKSSTATGTIKYAVYKDKECKELATSAGEGEVKEGKAPASEEKELEAGTVYYWQAEYGGDSLHEASTSSCSKEVLTVKAKMTLSTKLVGGGKEGEEIAVAEGSKVKDTATLSGTKSTTATGTVKYKVYKDKECKELVTSAGEVSVSGGSVPNSEEKELEAGKEYFWQAEYGGDSLHEASTSACNKEIEKVKANTSLSTVLLGEVPQGAEPNEGEEITVAAHSKVIDQATLSGANAATATGTATYNVYSNSTCKKLFAEGGEVTVEGAELPASEEVEFTEGTYYWQVEYSGDSLHEPSISTCTEIVTVRAATTLKTLLSGEGEVGEEEDIVTVGEGVGVTDSATLTGTNASKATGTVKYFVYSDDKCEKLLEGAGEFTVKGESVPSSNEVEFESGVYYWQAVYSGDSKNYASTSTCGSEIVIVNPPITTTLSGKGQSAAEITVSEGAGVSDAATLWSKHAGEATGTVEYAVYSDDKCKELVTKAGEVSVSGASVPSSEEKKLSPGTYFWQAKYSGDGKNSAATSICGTEVEIVETPTSVATTLSGGEEEGEEIVVDEGASVKDQASLSGTNAGSAEGSVAYRVYSDSKCTELAALAGDVSVSGGSVPKSDAVALPHGTYYWQAEYSGDGLNNVATSACGSEVEIVTALITTTLSDGEQSGEAIEVPEETQVTDEATLHTKHAAEATGTVKYFVYSDEECKELVAEAGEASVAGASAPKSSKEEFEEGTYYWQAVYSGDGKNPKATSRCGIEKEIVVNLEGDKYAALGDSFSSGEGVRFPSTPPGGLPRGEYYKATDIAAARKKHGENRCHRSPQAWPAIIVEEQLGAGEIAENKVLKKQPDHFIFRACSGAETKNLWRKGGGEAAAKGGQYDELLTPPTEWRTKPAQDLWLGLPGGAFPITGDNEQIIEVTATIGASDAGFPEVAQACSQNPGFFKRYSAIPCQETIEEGEEGFPSISEGLPVALQHMREIAPIAHIWIPLYPRLLDMSLASIPVERGRSVNNAAPGLEGLTAAQSLERYLGRLNRTIEEAVLEVDPVGARINSIQDTVNAFDNADGQHLLGSAEPWLDGIFIGVANKMESFHPDRCGQIEMARVVTPFLSKEATLPKAC
jgi:hypothetical protein